MRFQTYLSLAATLCFQAASASSLGHVVSAVARAPALCRTQPGDADFPSASAWASLNDTIGGRLIAVIPSAAVCRSLNCTGEQWKSTVFRTEIPGSMISYNWEQDYKSNPASLCFRNSTECGQGNVPVFAVNASSPTDVQAGITFASQHNLKVSIKSSGHDLLGRSTAKGSLLLWTHYFRNVSFTESFRVGGKDLGSAVTVGSGVRLNELYSLCREAGKFVVGGNAATVAAAGGYVQGAGHSAFSPAFGLAADNALAFDIVLANGSFVTANERSHTDLFWAVRGGGAGSWGVLTSATFQTFPIFNASMHAAFILTPTNEDAGTVAEIHARHAFDWDDVRAGQYFSVFNLTNPLATTALPDLGMGVQGNLFAVVTYFKDLTGEQANASMKPFLDDVKANNYSVIVERVVEATGNELLYSPDDTGGIESIMGSRLIPERVYRNNPAGIGKTYTALLEAGVAQLVGLMVAGGKVSENRKVNAAVLPKWRTAKMLLIVTEGWDDGASPEDVEASKQIMTNQWVPVLADLTGERDSGTYSNEADVREPNFQQTFYGSNYGRLRAVKRKYDPSGLFIVRTGVGSEEWDEAGICRR